MDVMALTAAENRLLRQQLHDMAGQLLTLTERMYSLTQDTGVTDRAPFGGRDEPHLAHFVVDDLRSDTFRVMPAVGLPTFREMVDVATWVERELADAHARQQDHERNREQKRTQIHPGDGFPNGRRPRQRPKTKQGTKSTPLREPEPGEKPCIICGGAHQVIDCSWRHDHCFGCGKPGHFRSFCPLNPGTVPSASRHVERGAATAPREDLRDGSA